MNIPLSLSAWVRNVKRIWANEGFQLLAFVVFLVLCPYLLLTFFQDWNAYIFIVMIALLVIGFVGGIFTENFALLFITFFLCLGFGLKSLTHDIEPVNKVRMIILNDGTVKRYEDVGRRAYILPEGSFTLVSKFKTERSYPVVNQSSSQSAQVLHVRFSVIVDDLDWLFKNQSYNLETEIDKLLLNHVTENSSRLNRLNLNDYLCRQAQSKNYVLEGEECPFEIKNFRFVAH